MLALPTVAKSLPQLLAGFALSEVADVRVTGASLDSRDIAAGDLFVALAGARHHGLDFAAAAVAAGAVAVVWEPVFGRPAPVLEVPAVAVPGLGRQVATIAARLYDDPSRALFAVGITGTDGKTSCAWLAARALNALELPCGYLGTLGWGALDDLAATTYTTPDAVRLQAWLAAMAGGGLYAAAVEVSSHALAQHRADAVAFDVAVLTQIGRDHLDYHGDQTSYIAAKRRLFELPGLRHLVLNADDAAGRQWLAAANDGVARIAYGRGESVAEHARHVRLAGVRAVPGGLDLDFATHLGRGQVKSRLLGAFNAYNLAAVLAVLLCRGAPLDTALEVLAGLPTVPGRMERVPGRADQPLVIVDYAHTPGALAAALDAVRDHAPKRVLCVFGCGGERDRGKRALMGEAAMQRAERVWLTDDNPRSEDPAAIVADIVAGIPGVVRAMNCFAVVHDRAAAIAAAIAAAGPGDVVLIAGKGHEATQQYRDRRQDFDDRVVARRALEAA